MSQIDNIAVARSVAFPLLEQGKQVLELAVTAPPCLFPLLRTSTNLVIVRSHLSQTDAVHDRLRAAHLDREDWNGNLAGRRFDVVIALDLDSFVGDVRMLLARLREHLKPDGLLLTGSPRNEEGASALESAGFAVIRSRDGLEHLIPALADGPALTADRLPVVAVPLPAECFERINPLLAHLQARGDAYRAEQERRTAELAELRRCLAHRDRELRHTLEDLQLQRRLREVYEAKINRIWRTLPFRVYGKLKKLLGPSC